MCLNADWTATRPGPNNLNHRYRMVQLDQKLLLYPPGCSM